MSNPYRHRVNYCLQEASKALREEGLAWQEIAVFFLWRAYTTYLRELAQQLGLPDHSFQTAGEIQGLLQADGRAAENVSELVALEADGWLGHLRQLWQDCLHPAVTGNPAVGIIAASQVQVPPSLASILGQFGHMLERQRMTNEEW